MGARADSRQAGISLVEVLIAILILSFGVLGLVGLQAVSTKQSTDARYRSEATLLADKLVGKMWVSDRSVLKVNFSSSPAGTEYTAWLGDASTPGTVLGTLPGVDSNPPVVQVDDTTGVVTIAVNWKAPYETSQHSFVLKTQLNIN